MKTEFREFDGFLFRVGELKGHRLVEVVFPERVNSSRLAMLIDPYFSLWDDNFPALQIIDVSQCEGLDDVAQQFFKLVIRRTIHQPGHLASAWIAGDNSHMTEDLERLLLDAVYTTQGLVKTRAEAEEFLRPFIDEPPPSAQ